MQQEKLDPEFDFTLVIDGVPELTEDVENSLFEAGCDDATFSIQYGRICAEFSRRAESLEDAVLSAIKCIESANIGANVVRVDECDLVTQAEIARRINRTRQQVCQFIKGTRGPGHFPPPECHLSEGAPLWRWCAVSVWLAENGIIRQDAVHDAEVISAINSYLEFSQHCKEYPELIREIRSVFPKEKCPNCP